MFYTGEYVTYIGKCINSRLTFSDTVRITAIHEDDGEVENIQIRTHDWDFYTVPITDIKKLEKKPASEPTPEQTATQDFDDAMKATWADPRSHTVKILPQTFDYRQAYEKSTEVIDSLINIIANSPSETPPTAQEPAKHEAVPVAFTPSHQSYDSSGDESEPYCPACDQELEDGWDYCPCCGVELIWPENMPEEPVDPKEPVKAKVESRPLKQCYLCRHNESFSQENPCKPCCKDHEDGYGHTQFQPKEDEKVEPEVSEDRKAYDKWVEERRCIACKGCGLPASAYPCKGCWIPNAYDNESIKDGLLAHPHFTAKPFEE